MIDASYGRRYGLTRPPLHSTRPPRLTTPNMSWPSSDAVPGSDDLAAIFTSSHNDQYPPSSLTTFSDDIAALHDCEQETKRAKAETG